MCYAQSLRQRMKHVATLIPDDGIGPEVTPPAQQVIGAATTTEFTRAVVEEMERLN
jgi:isocitrate/isopropylmalate dehydrogenase